MTGPMTGAEQARIADLRLLIDDLDRRIVALLAERTRVVRTLTENKHDEAAVRSPDRVAAVVARVRGLADEHGMPPGIAEATYRTLIGELTQLQLVRLAERRAEAGAGAGAGAGAAGSQEAAIGGASAGAGAGAAGSREAAIGGAEAGAGGGDIEAASDTRAGAAVGCDVGASVSVSATETKADADGPPRVRAGAPAGAGGGAQAGAAVAAKPGPS